MSKIWDIVNKKKVICMSDNSKILFEHIFANDTEACSENIHIFCFNI